MPGKLEGAVSVVTGSGRGIGAAVACELASLGARVALLARTTGEITEVAAQISFAGGTALPVSVDVTREEQVRLAFREVRERLGPVTHLVNNAGTVAAAPLADMTLAEWRENQDVNLTSTFLCSREALADMLPRGKGRIVNVASVSGVSNVSKFPGFVGYASAKAGVIAFTEALAAEVGEKGVRVLCVSPGAVETALLARVAPGFQAPLTPARVAKIVAFLCSEDAGAANGSNMVVWGK
ncbi:SDR family oxidoreductase [bacterium]|nr:SDR family oxidoreductase [bacterium]